MKKMCRWWSRSHKAQRWPLLLFEPSWRPCSVKFLMLQSKAKSNGRTSATVQPKQKLALPIIWGTKNFIFFTCLDVLLIVSIQHCLNNLMIHHSNLYADVYETSLLLASSMNSYLPAQSAIQSLTDKADQDRDRESISYPTNLFHQS